MKHKYVGVMHEMPREDAQYSSPYNPRAYEMDRPGHFESSAGERQALIGHKDILRELHTAIILDLCPAQAANAAPTADPTEPLAWACDRLPQPHRSSFAPSSFSTFYKESLQPVKSVIGHNKSRSLPMGPGQVGVDKIQFDMHPLSRYANQFPMWKIDGSKTRQVLGSCFDKLR
jgi:hypothetical protein